MFIKYLLCSLQLLQRFITFMSLHMVCIPRQSFRYTEQHKNELKRNFLLHNIQEIHILQLKVTRKVFKYLLTSTFFGKYTLFYSPMFLFLATHAVVDINDPGTFETENDCWNYIGKKISTV